MTETSLPALDPLLYRPAILRALEEDLGLAGDITTNSVVEPGARLEARLSSRQTGRIAGLAVALDVFRELEPGIETQVHCDDGSDVEPGATLAVLHGPARPILTGERTALNILARLSGIATATRRAVAAVGAYPTRVTCTRKTTPGLRSLEKYAVRVGGGLNHRFGLHDAVLIKDNHIAAAGGLRPTVARARGALGPMVRIEVEVDTLEQLREALEAGVEAVLLDNMTPDLLREAVSLVDGRAVTEASGGIRPDTIRDFAATGVDIVSLGWLTHSAASLDLGLDAEPL